MPDGQKIILFLFNNFDENFVSSRLGGEKLPQGL